MKNFNIVEFKKTILSRLGEAESYSEQYDYLEGIKDTLEAFNVIDDGVDGMLCGIMSDIEKAHVKEYG